MLGKKLKTAIKNAGMTQEDFAKKMKTSRALVSQWIIGVRNPSPKNLKKISEALNIPINNFLDDKFALSSNMASKIKSIEEKNIVFEEKIKRLESENFSLKKEIELIKIKLDKKK